MTSTSTTRTWLLVLAFAAIYLIWGSTYLAIRFAVQTMPPLLVAGFRFLIAGACVLTWSFASGAQRPQLAPVLASSSDWGISAGGWQWIGLLVGAGRFPRE